MFWWGCGSDKNYWMWLELNLDWCVVRVVWIISLVFYLEIKKGDEYYCFIKYLFVWIIINESVVLYFVIGLLVGWVLCKIE